MNKNPSFKELSAHFATHLSPEILQYVRDVVFLQSRYLFTRRDGKRQFGYCTHCRQESETSGYKHGEFRTCPLCSSECAVRASGRGRSRMIDEAYFVYYEKSLVNPEAIVARGFYAIRDYRDDYRVVEALIEPKAMYLFEPGNAVMFERPWLYYYESQHRMSSGTDWRQNKSVSSLAKSVMSHKPCYCSMDSLRTAIAGTKFQYSTWEQYKDGSDMVKFFDLAAKYPCVEYLTKLGLRGLVDAKLNGGRTYNVVNWRATNPQKVLRMTKQEFNELRSSGVYVDPWLLQLHQLSKRDGSNLSFNELSVLRRDFTGGYRDYLETALARTTLKRLNSYFDKQLENPEVRQRYKTKHELLYTWNDYLKDCTRLGLDTMTDAVKFPSSLYQAHQNTIAQIKIKADEMLKSKVAERCKSLRKYRFEAQGFIVRPAESPQELIDEGKALNHCVGTYADRYANGNTDIFFIRKTDAPEKPFYTMEVQKGHIVQCRGLRNCTPTDEVKAFIDLFVIKKLPPKQQTGVSVAV